MSRVRQSEQQKKGKQLPNMWKPTGKLAGKKGKK